MSVVEKVLELVENSKRCSRPSESLESILINFDDKIKFVILFTNQSASLL